MHAPIVGIVGLRSPLKVAVQAAIDAYAASGHMLDAALAYAAHGFPVFPLSEKTKAPIPKRDKDADGNEIPRTGGFYKATTNPIQIGKWWKRRERLIGMPMGPRSGAWTLDIDTVEDHTDDGMAAWQKLTAEYGAIDTRQHRTATEGLHLIFEWDDERPIGCSRGSVPKGIEVKGVGGYIVMPPSRRKKRNYYVEIDIDPISAPDWLVEIIGTRPAPSFVSMKPQPDDVVSDDDVDNEWSRVNNIADLNTDGPVDLAELADALDYVPNDNLPWDEWTKMALALFAITGGSEQGYELFVKWSKKSTAKHDPATTRERWEEISGSPPNRIGANYIYRLAMEHGWRIAPTAPPASYDELDAARREVRRIAHAFLHLSERPKNAFDYFMEFAEACGIEVDQPVWAMRIDTGVGKTRIVVEEIAKSGKTVIYVVPTHRLGSGVVDLFASHGLVARTFRGRMANDPENPGSRMCLNLPAVELALKAHADVAKTCCKHKKQRCRFYDACGYQRQLQEEPQIWIVASDIIFHTQAALKKPKPKALIIDEAVWQKSLRGVELTDQWTVPFASLANGSQRRRDLADELQMQADDGGLQRKYIEGMDPAALSRMISAEWAEIKRLKFNLYPGMPDHEFTQLQKNTKAIDKIAHTRRVIQILEELREMLNHSEIAVSGRLLLDQCNGQRVIRWRGVAHISKQFKVPTLLLDATLPDLAILQVLHPQIEIVADIRVTLPSDVHVRQVRDAPTSSRKLIDSTRKNPERHLKAVRRYVLQRWLENGKGSAVVICQQQVEEWLEDKVPDAIEVAHFNAIAGLDVYRDVRLLILVGRVQPGPEAVEALAATLSGSMPVSVSPGPNGFAWYRRVRRGIRLRDGSGIAVIGDQHPDAFVESVRQLICEAELVQALGRARAVNRSAQTPLDVELLLDVCLPVVVDEVANWSDPSLLIETAAEGVMLTSPVDMVRLWPTIWRNTRAADRTLAMGVPALPGFERVSYQLEGAKMKPRIAYFDPDLIPDPRAWLEARLGPLSDLSR